MPEDLKPLSPRPSTAPESPSPTIGSESESAKAAHAIRQSHKAFKSAADITTITMEELIYLRMWLKADQTGEFIYPVVGKNAATAMKQRLYRAAKPLLSNQRLGDTYWQYREARQRCAIEAKPSRDDADRWQVRIYRVDQGKISQDLLAAIGATPEELNKELRLQPEIAKMHAAAGQIDSGVDPAAEAAASAARLARAADPFMLDEGE